MDEWGPFGLEAERVVAEWLRRRGLTVWESGAQYSGRGRDPGDLIVDHGGKTLRVEVKRSSKQFPYWFEGCSNWPASFRRKDPRGVRRDVLFVDSVDRFDHKRPKPDWYFLLPLDVTFAARVNVADTMTEWFPTGKTGYTDLNGGQGKRNFYCLRVDRMNWRWLSDVPQREAAAVG